MHVSTAYANCPQSVIEEKFYDSPMDSDKLIALMECVEDKLAEDITPQYVDIFPLLNLQATRMLSRGQTKPREDNFFFSCLQIIRKMAEYLYVHESGRRERDKEAGR